jgi:hypothetical protein
MLPYPTQLHSRLNPSNPILGILDRPPYAATQVLDPLNVDDFMQHLPNLTDSGQLDAILDKLALIVKHFDKAIYDSIPHSFAALRDFDFLISSANIITIHSHKHVQGLESILETLGISADHNPRGCNFTYGLFNPVDSRIRTFTGLSEESTFIHAIQQGTRNLDDALLTLSQLSTVPIDSEDFEFLTAEFTGQFDSMIPAVVQVLKTVTAEVFSHKIVKFFIPLDINGKTYPGITGAQAQNIGIDFIIFGVDLREEPYISYISENLAAMLPFHKLVIDQTLQQLQHTSLLSKIYRDLESRDKINSIQATRSLDALQYFLQRVLSFRMVHRRLAAKSLPLRKVESGSGGYNLDLLDYLIFRTREAKHSIDEIKARL